MRSSNEPIVVVANIKNTATSRVIFHINGGERGLHQGDARSRLPLMIKAGTICCIHSNDVHLYFDDETGPGGVDNVDKMLAWILLNQPVTCGVIAADTSYDVDEGEETSIPIIVQGEAHVDLRRRNARDQQLLVAGAMQQVGNMVMTILQSDSQLMKGMAKVYIH